MKKILVIALVAVVAVIGAILTAPKAPTAPEQVPAEEAVVAIQSISMVDSLASPASNGARSILWQSSGYPANQGVDINLIRKTSDSPESYVFVRKIAENTANDGNEVWIPNAGEASDDLFIEVTCAAGVGDVAGCRISSKPIKAF